MSKKRHHKNFTKNLTPIFENYRMTNLMNNLDKKYRLKGRGGGSEGFLKIKGIQD